MIKRYSCQTVDGFSRMYRTVRAITRLQPICAVLLSVAVLMPVHADEVERVLFLVVERDEVIASNTKAGRFDRLKLHAKERVLDYEVANAVAVVVTNQRYAAYGVLSGGWQSIKLIAQEKTQSIQVADYSATIVSSDRVLNFYGRSGTWNETRRGVQFR